MRERRDRRELLAWFVVGAVVLGWLANVMLLPVIVRGYTPDPSMNTLIGIIAGAACAFVFARRGENGKKRNGDS